MSPVGWGLEGKVALITGAASGQGRAAARALRRGRRSGRRRRHRRRGCGRDGGSWSSRPAARRSPIHADVSRRADATRWSPRRSTRSGGSTCSTTTPPCRCRVACVECTEDDWDLHDRDQPRRDLLGVPRRDPRDARGRRRHRIINTASVLGLIGSEGYCAYGAAKAGLVALTRQIAVEYGPEVRANVIAPGSIDTPRFRKVADEMGDDRGVPRRMLDRNIPLHAARDRRRRRRHRAVPRVATCRRTRRARSIPADGGLAALR